MLRNRRVYVLTALIVVYVMLVGALLTGEIAQVASPGYSVVRAAPLVIADLDALVPPSRPTCQIQDPAGC